jgi:hypothetical protein
VVGEIVGQIGAVERPWLAGTGVAQGDHRCGFAGTREEFDDHVHGRILGTEHRLAAKGRPLPCPTREKCRVGVINGRFLLLEPLVLFSEIALALERIVERREHRVVAVGILEHVDLMVGEGHPPQVLLVPGWPHQERDLGSIPERHEQGDPLVMAEIADRFDDHLLAPNEQRLEPAFPPQEPRLGGVHLLRKGASTGKPIK